MFRRRAPLAPRSGRFRHGGRGSRRVSDRPEKEVPRDGDGALPSIGALLQASNWEDRVAEARARREKVLAQGGGAERPLRPAETPASTPAPTPADSAPSEPAPPPRGAAVPLRVVEGGATEATPSAPEKRRDVTTQDDRPRWVDTLGPMAPRDDPATFQSIRPAEFIPIPSWPSSVQSDAPRSERRRGLLVPLGVALAVGLGFGLGAWFASPGEEPAGRSAPEAAAPEDTAALREPVPPTPDAEPRAAVPREEAADPAAPSPDAATFREPVSPAPDAEPRAAAPREEAADPAAPSPDAATFREPVSPAPDAEPRAAAPREEAAGPAAPSPDTAADAASGAPIDAPRPAEITAPPATDRPRRGARGGRPRDGRREAGGAGGACARRNRSPGRHRGADGTRRAGGGGGSLPRGWAGPDGRLHAPSTAAARSAAPGPARRGESAGPGERAGAQRAGRARGGAGRQGPGAGRGDRGYRFGQAGAAEPRGRSGAPGTGPEPRAPSPPWPRRPRPPRRRRPIWAS